MSRLALYTGRPLRGPIRAVAGTPRTIQLALYDGTAAIDLTGRTVTFEMERLPGMRHLSRQMTVDTAASGEVSITLTGLELTEGGEYPCRILVADSEGAVEYALPSGDFGLMLSVRGTDALDRSLLVEAAAVARALRTTPVSGVEVADDGAYEIITNYEGEVPADTALASALQDGLMSSEDKEKLDGVATGALDGTGVSSYLAGLSAVAKGPSEVLVPSGGVVERRAISVASFSALASMAGQAGAILQVGSEGSAAWAASYAATPESAAGVPQADAEAAGLIVPITGGGGKVWRRVLGPDRVVTPQMAGAAADWDGTTGTDDQAALEACFELLKYGYSVSLPAGAYYAGSLVTMPLRSESRVEWKGTLYTSAGLVIGDGTLAVGADISDIKVRVPGAFGTNAALDWDDQIGVHLVNLYGCRVRVGDVIGFQTNIKCEGDDNAFATNQIELGRLRNAEKSLVLRAGGTTGFCNENTFYGGGFVFGSDMDPDTDKATAVHLSMEYEAGNTNTINNNTFFRPAFEAAESNGWKAFAVGGQANDIINPRMERADVGEFVTGSQYCRLISSYPIVWANITDNGYLTQIETYVSSLRRGFENSDTGAALRVENRAGATSAAVAAYWGTQRGAALSGDGSVMVGANGLTTRIYNSFSSPEGSINAPRGSICMRRQDFNYLPTVYVKNTGSGNTGWLELVQGSSGTTANRPANAATGQMYFDTDEGRQLFWNGSGIGWKTADGGAPARPSVADSTATDAAGIVSDFNDLLDVLRDAGVLAP